MTYGLRAMRRPLMRDPRLLIDWHGGTPFPAGGYSRGSDGATRGADGAWRLVAPAGPRTTWRRDASGLLVPATLLEPAATNLATRSSPTRAQLSTAGPGVEDAAWPNASFPRAIRVPAGTGVDERVYTTHGNLSAQAGQVYTASVYVYMEDHAGPPVVGWEGLPIGTVHFAVAIQGMVAGHTVFRVEDLGGSLYRVSARRTLTADTSGSVGVIRYAGHAQRPFRVTGIQMEAGWDPTSPIQTTGAAATRARDTLYLDLPAEIGRPGAALAIYSRYVMLHEPTVGFSVSPVAWAISGASGTGPRLYHYQNSANSRLSLRHDVSPTSAPFESVTLATPVPAPGNLVEALSLIWTDAQGRLTGRLIASVNGGPLAAGDLPPLAPAAAWSAPRLYVGSRGTAPGVYEWERLRVWSGFIAGSDERRFAHARGEI